MRAAAAVGARVASICTGAFILAQAGLLDGQRATTHWLAAAELARRYPTITVDPDVLDVDNGNVLTSARAAAGLDLCLHLVRRDHGALVAANTARVSVMPLERTGGQAQFIAHVEPNPATGSLEPVLRWLERNAQRDLTLTDIARRAAMSTRTLNRRFDEQTGTTPLQWLVRARTRRAQHLLETTTHSIERVASRAGFGSAAVFRARFQRVVGTSPRAYRRTFGGASYGPWGRPVQRAEPGVCCPPRAPRGAGLCLGGLLEKAGYALAKRWRDGAWAPPCLTSKVS